MISNYDVCIFVESKTDKFDILDVPQGYSYFSKIRENFKKSQEVLLLYIKAV